MAIRYRSHTTRLVKMGPPSFSPDGERIAYTVGTWETWSVPVLGGEPTRLLAQTEGLSWTNTNPTRVMYSANTGEGIHMGIFASTESREPRTVYLPASVDGMAHRSFFSPEGKSVIVVEMNVGQWLPCRSMYLCRLDARRRMDVCFSL
jgi:hypothetical protein